MHRYLLLCFFAATVLFAGEKPAEITETQKQWFYEYIKRNDLPKLKELVAKNPDYLKLRYDSYQKNTVLQSAVFEQKLEIVGWMIDELKCDVNELNALGETALRVSAFRNNRELSMLLIEKGARGDVGENHAHRYLIEKGHQAAIEALLKLKQLDVKAQEPDGRTALFWAALYGKRGICELLLKHGSDPNVTTKQGWTPLYMVSMSAHDKSELEERTACAEVLLANKANPNLADDGGNTPLHRASAERNNAMIDLLLSKGAKVNAVNAEGETPLHLAAQFNATSVLRPLLSKGADYTIKNKKGKTPFMLASGDTLKEFKNLGIKK